MNFNINHHLLAENSCALEVLADYLEENAQQPYLHFFLRTWQYEERGFSDGFDRKEGDGYDYGYGYGNGSGKGYGYGWGDGCGYGYGNGYSIGYGFVWGDGYGYGDEDEGNQCP
jgi:hypothetical protein